MFTVRYELVLNACLDQLSLKKALPWHRGLVAGLSPWMPGFCPRPIRTRFLLDRVALGQDSVRVLRFVTPSVVPSVRHTQLHVPPRRQRVMCRITYSPLAASSNPIRVTAAERNSESVVCMTTLDDRGIGARFFSRAKASGQSGTDQPPVRWLHSFRWLSCDRSVAYSKADSPQSAV